MAEERRRQQVWRMGMEMEMGMETVREMVKVMVRAEQW